MRRGAQGKAKLAMGIDTVSGRYARAEARVAMLVARATIAGTLGSAKVRKAVKREVGLLLDEVHREGLPEAQRLVSQAYDLGRRLAEAETVNRKDDSALALLQDNVSNTLKDATVHVGRRVDDVFRKEAIRTLAGGGTPSSLEKKLRRSGIGSFRDVKGRLWLLSDYTKMALQTTTAEATFSATTMALQRAGEDLVDVNHSPNCCNLCQPYDGNTYSLTGATRGYPVLSVAFPIHPLCQHFVTKSTKS